VGQTFIPKANLQIKYIVRETQPVSLLHGKNFAKNPTEKKKKSDSEFKDSYNEHLKYI